MLNVRMLNVRMLNVRMFNVKKEEHLLNKKQASSPPMLHYALGMDFPIHTRNT